MGTKLYIGNLPYSSTDADLLTLFSQAGTVKAVQVIRDPATGGSKGFAFVEMSSEEEAKVAVTLFNSKDFSGRPLTVNIARSREERHFSPSFYFPMLSPNQGNNSDTKPSTVTHRLLRVFLCHAHSDAFSVRDLYNRLTKSNVDAWLDKEKLLPGSDWEYEIRKAVREADVIVVCLSKNFNQRGFRQKEVRLALEVAMEQPEGEIFIIPARLEECESLESLKKWHWVDLYEIGGYEKLIQALKTRAQKVGASLK